MPITRNEEHTYYEYKELSAQAQQHALEKLADVNVDFDWWDCDGLLDPTKDELRRMGVKHAPVCRAFTEQDAHGKNVSKHEYFTADDQSIAQTPRGNPVGYFPDYTGLVSYKISYFDLDRGSYLQFENIRVSDPDVFRRFLRIPSRLWDCVSYSFTNTGSGNHQSTSIEFDWEDPARESDKNHGILDNAAAIFDAKVEEALRDLRKNYEWLTGEEGITEWIDANDVLFDEQGDPQYGMRAALWEEQKEAQLVTA